jgi:hypothetical protein
MKTSLALTSGVLLVALLACSGTVTRQDLAPSSPRHASADSTGTPPPPCTTDRPDYEAEVAPLVERYCTSCHSPGGDAGDEHDFTDLQLLRSQHKLVSARLRVHSMPPTTSPQPSEEERARLRRWADCD